MIHPQAIVEPGAKLADDVEVGPWSYIGADVEIGAGCRIGPHAVIKGPTKMGKNNRVFQFTSIGEDCQDKKYQGEPTELVIGDDNVFREGCTIHRGTVQDNSITIIGSDNLFMANAHVAHDCVVGNHNIIANNAALAGHVHLGDYIILGGFTAVHQFCHIGSYSMCGAGTVVLQDVPAFVMCNGNSAKPHGINSVGLRRKGYSDDAIRTIKRAYRLIYRSGLKLDEALAELQKLVVDCAEVQLIIDSLKSSERGIIR
ncbi:acyl-ACP--UDP-N-acetylglucosamine O-acyltransferase [Aliamphritea spongicola]|uniref:acyl-ACP--UDP-N-acetylglucosamine O-acyltransferase n=1 Tax=Aliamphritea spongicola TaxID=707589 RepID=UPI00196ADFBC|nr:acyl-ACP--UDP-N-acetylglucosamine O-acyltransferase [Aliamphritea spongicola]MBN3564145.1 acyl-ACP--UDP-N-acetylglucosamine O-acyltransferase [Aliamphritea spongicola]